MRDPDLSGVARAWRLNINASMSEAHRREWGYDHTGIATWYVCGPYHPFWSWWYIGLISLADVPGVPPANKVYPEAEYELTFVSLDGDPNLDALEQGRLEDRGYTFLSPPDLVFQFNGVTREQAVEIAEAAVRMIVAGQSCDSDFREWWRGALETTVQHYKEGIHG